MKVISLIIFIFSFVTVDGQRTTVDDSLCLESTKRATKDLKAGELRFCTSATWNLPFARMFTVLDSLCKGKNLILTPYPYIEHDYGFDPYTCYSTFMDSVVIEKYGNSFKNLLYRQADSLFIVSHYDDTIPAYHCDKRVTYFNKHSLEKDFFKGISLPKICAPLLNCNNCSDYRVIFLVDLKGHATDYKVYHTDTSNKCNSSINKAIVDALQRINKWRPGILGKRKVISYGDLLIDLSRRRII